MTSGHSISDPLIAADAVTSTEVLAEERRTVFTTRWLYAGCGAEFATSGDFVRRTVGCRPIFLVRGRDGVGRVFLNSCTHRGALVCRQDSGNSRLFSCFYHNWAFNDRGELSTLPGEEAYGAEWDRAELGLKSPQRVENWRGLCFVAFDGSAPDLTAQLDAIRAAVDLWMDSDAQPHTQDVASQRFELAANWKVAVTTVLGELSVGASEVLDLGHGGLAFRRRGRDRRESTGDDGVTVFVQPNLLLHHGKDRVICRFEPREPGKTQMTITVLNEPGGRPSVASLALVEAIEDVEIAQRHAATGSGPLGGQPHAHPWPVISAVTEQWIADRANRAPSRRRR